MTIHHVIQAMQDDGFNFDYQGDTLRVMPKHRLTDTQRTYLKANKSHIIHALKNPLLVTVYCPNGKTMQIQARDQDHAHFLLRMNPPPKPKNTEYDSEK